MTTQPRDHDPRAASRAPSGEIRVLVNGESVSLALGASVADLLRSLRLGERRVAVAVNRCVVPRSRHGEHRLASNDHVEILEAVGGG